MVEGTATDGELDQFVRAVLSVADRHCRNQELTVSEIRSYLSGTPYTVLKRN